MNCIRLFKHWGGILWLALFFVYALEAQNTEVPEIIQDLDASVELAVFRKIVPEDREELYYLEEGQFYQTKRKVGAPWGKINQSDSVLGFYVMDHWPALRDDLVKPFRQKPISSNAAAGNQNQNAVDNKAISGQNLTEIGVKAVISKDYSFQYVLLYRNIWVERAFNQKDIDPRWAKENETYTFNQTLKLTKMHQIMDALFLIKPR